MASRETDKPGILVYSHGWVDKLDGDAIEPVYETVTWDFGSAFGSVQPKYALAYAIGYGNNDLELNYNVNHSLDDVRASAQLSDQQDPNDRLDVYGTAVWGTARWGVKRPVVVRFDISATDVGPARELSLTFTPASRKMEIVSLSVGIAVGEQRLIKPLNEALAPDKR
jgi:hypothetical protein